MLCACARGRPPDCQPRPHSQQQTLQLISQHLSKSAAQGCVRLRDALKCISGVYCSQAGRSWHDTLVPSSLSMIYDFQSASSEPCTAAASFLCFQPRTGVLTLRQSRALQMTLWHNFCTSTYGCWGQALHFWHVCSSGAKTSVQLPF